MSDCKKLHFESFGLLLHSPNVRKLIKGLKYMWVLPLSEGMLTADSLRATWQARPSFDPAFCIAVKSLCSSSWSKGAGPRQRTLRRGQEAIAVLMHVTYFGTVWNSERLDRCTWSQLSFIHSEALAWSSYWSRCPPGVTVRTFMSLRWQFSHIQALSVSIKLLNRDGRCL